MKYYLNEEVFISIEGHKANKIGEDIIVTFLPEDVVDGLYSAVGQAKMTVANMTLEPIAAINVAIPENFRMLNIALVLGCLIFLCFKVRIICKIIRV